MGRLYAASLESARSGEPLAERLAERAATRREFLIAGAAGAAGAALALAPLSSVGRALGARSGAARVAIVGGGLAGLACARELVRGGARPTLFEGNPERIGGRCWTLRGYFDGGISVEHGGAFIDTNQWAIRRLARELGLAEEEVNGGDLPEGEEVFFDSLGIYSLAQATSDWQGFGYDAVRAAVRRAQSASGRRELDALSVPEWLDESGIEASSRLGLLLQSSAVAENGADPAEQSSLDLISLIEGNARRELGSLSGVDERFHIVGGNDQIASAAAAELPSGTIRMGRRLIAVRRTPAGGARLAFESGGSVQEASFDIVVFCLPFTMLRDVDLGASGLSARKLRVIETAGMGTNAKIHFELTHKTWPALGYSGSIYGEPGGLACGWDDCVPLGPAARPAVYCAFPGGRRGAGGLTGAAHGPAPTADLEWALGEVERAFPGTAAAARDGEGDLLPAYEDHWSLDPWVRGAYSFDKVGQAVSYRRLAPAPDGPYLFAGEQTADENQGYLDGAVQTGERAAREALRLL